MADEDAVRTRLRDDWPSGSFGEAAWVEFAHGGSVGCPDVFLPLGAKRGYCPVELKWWEVLKGGRVSFYARPAQLRFHRLAFEAGQRTAFVAQLSSGDIVVLPGGACRWDWRDAMSALRFVPGLGSGLKKTLLDESFWKLEKK